MLSEEILRRIVGAKMINFGSGPSAYAFDYEAAGVCGVNLGFTPSAFGMETALLREYHAFFRRGCAAVFTVCPFSFGENKSNADPERYARYYAVLSRKTWDTLPPPLPRYDPAVLTRCDRSHPLFPYGDKDPREEIPTEAQIEKRIDDMCRCWEDELGLSGFTDASQADRHRSAFTRERKALEELIAIARTLGIRPFLLLPPLHERLRARISPTFFDAFITRQINGIGVPVLDHTADPQIDPGMFLGPVFLNKKGACRLTASVWEQVSVSAE